MKFKVAVLSFLVLALVALVGLFYQNSRSLDELRRDRAESEKQRLFDEKAKDLERREKELEELKVRSMANSNSPQTGPAAAPSAADKSDREKQLEAELAKYKEQADVAKQEANLLIQKTVGDNSPKSKLASIIDNAQAVGKVLVYEKKDNLLIFRPIGQPGLVNGQELGIRRNSAVSFYLKVEEFDQDSGTYSASVRLDDFMKWSDQANSDGEYADPIVEGEDVIILPDEVKMELMPLKDDSNAPKNGSGPAPRSSAPEETPVTPWTPI